MEDKLIMEKLRNKDEYYFNILYKKYHSKLVVYAKCYLFDISESEDVVQDVFINFWNKIDVINVSRSIQDYLYTSVKHKCLDRLKALKLTDKHQLLYIETLLCEMKSSDHSNENNNKLLYEAIAKLPKQRAEIFLMRYYDGCKVKEIATQLNISDNTVKTQLSRSKKMIRKILKNKIAFNMLLSGFCVF